jgi:hypothetical protein
MYKKQIEMIDTLRKFLAEKETDMQLLIKKILTESLNNNDIRAMFFECENVYSDLNIMFYAVDNNKKTFLMKKNIMNEINGKSSFFEYLSEKEDEIYEDKGRKYEYLADYFETKGDIVLNWFILCWDKIKEEYNNIPDTFLLTLHIMISSAINLNTKEEFRDNERIKLMKSLAGKGKPHG